MFLLTEGPQRLYDLYVNKKAVDKLLKVIYNLKVSLFGQSVK